jgi:hypothetical protein
MRLHRQPGTRARRLPSRPCTAQVCDGYCPTVDDYWRNGMVCMLPESIGGAYLDATVCTSNQGLQALQFFGVTLANGSTIGTAYVFRSTFGQLVGTLRLKCVRGKLLEAATAT